MSRREVLNLGGTLDFDLAHLPFESALNLATSRSWLEIDLDAIKTNISTMREITGRGVEILLPLKADGYGHGASEVAYEAIRCGIRWFGVASLEEALSLRRGGVLERVLLLTPPPAGTELELLVTASITPVIADLDVACRLNELAGREGVVFPVHIEVDTGMGRTGVSWRKAVSFIKEVKLLPDLNVEGIFSHFSSADEEDLSFTNLQLERFNGLMTVVKEEILDPPIIHISNSAAALRLQGAGLPMIRPGLFIYGISPLHSPGSQPFRPVPAMSFRSRVVYVKDVDKGDSIGYGRSFVAPGKMKIATVAVGYRDGLNYRLSNRGEVLIGGRRCRIVGNICMDMLMVDVTSHGDVRPGDLVTILGRDKGRGIGAEALANLTGTISYDIVTKLGNKVPRLFFRGGEPVKITSFLGTWEAKGKERDQRDR